VDSITESDAESNFPYSTPIVGLSAYAISEDVFASNTVQDYKR
jgi:hypothetical protein